MAIAALLLTTLAPLTLSVGPGTPYPELAEALEHARQVRAGRPVVLNLAAGVTPLKQSLTIGDEDGPLVLRGPTKGKAKILGGHPVMRWRAVTDIDLRERLPAKARAAARVADLRAEGVTDYGAFRRRGFALSANAGLEVFQGTEPLHPARYPNPSAADRGWLRIGEPVEEKSFRVPGSRPAAWKSLEDVWVYGYWNFDWADSYEQVVDYDAASSRLSTANKGGEYGFAKGRRFFFSHVLEELDEPGEWWLDRNSGRLVVWPTKPVKAGEILVSALDQPLITIQNAHDVRIENLTIEVGRGAGITISNSKQVVVSGCTIRNFGTHGVVIQGGDSCGVADSTITGCGETGITLDGGDRKLLTPSRHFVNNCEIRRVSRWCRTYRPAVAVRGVGQQVAGNTLTDLPHNAIHLSGNDHLLERNQIERVCTDTGDAGAIYMGRDATQRGTLIRHNRFRSVDPAVNTQGNFTEVMSVYLDDCIGGFTIVGNIFEVKGTAVMIGGGRDNVVEGNVFLGPEIGISFDARAKGWAKDHFKRGGTWRYFDLLDAMNVTEPPYRDRYPALASAVLAGDDLAHPSGNVVRRNLFFGHGTWIRYLDGLSQKDLEYGDNVVADRGRTLAEALKLAPAGFPPIPVGKIGARPRR